MGVAAVALAHLLHGLGEQAIAVEDASIFSEKTEDQSRHEVIHVMATLGSSPIRVLAQQFHIELVQPPCGANVDGVVLDLLDGGDTRQRQEEAKMVGKVSVSAGDGFAASQFFGFQRLAVSG